MTRVYLQTGEILEGRKSAVKRALIWMLRYNKAEGLPTGYCFTERTRDTWYEVPGTYYYNLEHGEV